MSRLYLRRKTWWCWGFDSKGKRWARSTKQHDKRAAERAARRIEIELADQAHDARPLALSKAVAELFAHLRKDKRSEVTIEIYESKAGHLARILGTSRDISKLTEADTLAYWTRRSSERVDASDPGPSPHTIQKELRVLVQALRYCKRAGLCKPVCEPGDLMPKELAQGRVYQPRERWLPRDTEYPRLLMALSADRRDYLVAFCFTGLRLSELYKVHAYHIDIERRELDADGTKTRRSKRIIPLSDEAFEVFARRAQARPEGPLFDDWGKLHRDVSAACRRAGIEKASPNDFRRSFCSWLALAGVPMLTASRLLGHASTKMVEQVYAQLSREAMHDAVAKLNKPKADPTVAAKRGRKRV